MKTTRTGEPTQASALRVSPAGARSQTKQFKNLMRVMTHAHGREVHFEIAATSGSRVYVAGTFNRWDPTTHPLTYHPEDGLFKADLHLPAGTHEYKFVVNGTWHIDEKCPHWALNSHGTLNSVIRV